MHNATLVIVDEGESQSANTLTPHVSILSLAFVVSSELTPWAEILRGIRYGHWLG